MLKGELQLRRWMNGPVLAGRSQTRTKCQPRTALEASHITPRPELTLRPAAAISTPPPALRHNASESIYRVRHTVYDAPLAIGLLLGQPQCLGARVAIGQVPSVRCKWQQPPCSGGIAPCKVQVPGRQKIIVSRKWGFTKFSRSDYLQWKSENKILPDGVNAKLLGCHGPLANRQPGRAFLSEGPSA
ncbi:UNVERIFIED_CONTAM: 60S ribosomal protein L10 [Sesamum calycinum]|uniref:60S ribosomal protein L10 n=1 Tax=Sesamum calycinum TaxID=2727403 RepID=A0AAW2JE88_9LAMI